MKRYLSLILVVVMFLSMLPRMSAAPGVPESEGVEHAMIHTPQEEFGEPDDSGTLGNLYWAFYQDEGTLVIYGEGEMDAKPNTSKPLMVHQNSIYQIVIQPGVTTVAPSAFDRFFSVREVILPDTVTKIDTYAFAHCTSLQSITIPGSVSEIEYGAFFKCGLSEVVIEPGVATIGDFGFYQCSNLKQFTIPDSVTSIGEQAFMFSSKLESIHIGSGLSSIGDGAFSSCLNLRDISVTEGNPYFMVDSQGILFDKEQKTLVLYPPTLEGDSYTIPDSVEIIAPYAFSYSPYLSHISIEDHVKAVGSCAFYSCKKLRTVKIGNGVTAMEAQTFGNCGVLEKVEMGDNIVTIGSYAFESCKRLRDIQLPGHLTTMGIRAFFDCDSLEYIYIPASVTDIGNEAFLDCDFMDHVHFLGNKPTMGYWAFDVYQTYFPDPNDNMYMDYYRTFLYIEGTTGWEDFEHDLVPWAYEYHDYCHGEFYYCPFCRTEYVISKDGTHEWDEGRITTEPNCVTPGVCTYTCTLCSLVEEETVEPMDTHCYEFDVCIQCGLTDPNGPAVDENIKINHTLNLASDIAINYLVQETMLRDYETVYMECLLPIYEGNTPVGSKSLILEPVLRGGYYYFTLDGILSPEMNNVVKVRIYGTKGGIQYVSTVDEYSVATYAYNRLANSQTPEKLKAICANLLQYGAKVQSWKGYRTDALADGNMTKEMKVYVTDLSTVQFQNHKAYWGDQVEAGVKVKGVSMQLNSKIIVRYIIDPGTYVERPEELSLKIGYIGTDGEKEVTLTDIALYDEGLGYYVFDFDGLLASELRTVMSVAVYAEDAKVSETLEYSVDSYGNGKAEPILTIVRAMIAYCDSAKDYFG